MRGFFKAMKVCLLDLQFFFWKMSSNITFRNWSRYMEMNVIIFIWKVI